MEAMDNNGGVQDKRPAFLRFVNQTSYDIEIFGKITGDDQEQSFGCVAPGKYVDSNTYTTYQFVFREVASKCKMTVDGEKIYFPEPWVANKSRTRHSIGRLFRTVVVIEIPHLALAQLCLMVIVRRLKTADDVISLELPDLFEGELKKMVLNKVKRKDFVDLSV